MKKRQYICELCGDIHNQWSGKCRVCHQWNCITEMSVPQEKEILSVPLISLRSISEKTPEVETIDSGFKELNRVLGKGIIPGSVILIGGSPGIGKSTLLLQIGIKLGAQCCYLSGEEEVGQIRLRAHRMGFENSDILCAHISLLEEIVDIVTKVPQLKCLIVDSIQTIRSQTILSPAGSIPQIKFCTLELVQIAKKNNIALIIVGHITKDGDIAGPKMMEHMVDTVLYFEGEGIHRFRILRSFKNRFGATNEIALFDMTESEGLKEISNPSEMLIGNQTENNVGCTITAALEGTRPILLEVQALVVNSFLPSPRRSVVGCDYNRLAMILAVLEKHLSLPFSSKEVYINLTGGIRITETAIDLAIATALISSLKNKAVDRHTIFIGEISLSGEIRNIPCLPLRIKEAEKMNFSEAIVPLTLSKKEQNTQSSTISVKEVKNLLELYKIFW